MQAVLPRYLLFAAIVAAGTALDLATKAWAFRRLGMPGGQIEWIWPGRVGFQTSLNEGALFGLGQGGVPVFVAISVLAGLAILIWLVRILEWMLTVALAFIASGILGNLYDRLGLHGLQWPAGIFGRQAGTPIRAVRDWILVMIFGWPWPNFNIADSLLVCGAVLLVWHAFRSEVKSEQKSDQKAET